MEDIYYEKNYGKLYEDIENGKSIVYEYKSEIGEVFHTFIKRKIDTSIDNNSWYDLITPYGYGGPLIRNCLPGKEGVLVREFYNDFSYYCKANNIVSEFIRFHPILDNAKDFKDMYEVTYMRNTVGTNLKSFEDPFQSEFSKSCRKDVRRALRNGIDFEIIENPQDLNCFKRIYYSTMDRNNATDYYYFDDKYFNSCLKLFKDNLITTKANFEGKTIAEGLYFKYKDVIHMHLSGTLEEYLYLSPAYILKYAITTWGKENGYSLIHHGGGMTNSQEDSLYRFKKQFGRNTEFKFYIGKKIWNEDIYKKLCEGKNINRGIDFFPVYRN